MKPSGILVLSVLFFSPVLMAQDAGAQISAEEMKMLDFSSKLVASKSSEKNIFAEPKTRNEMDAKAKLKHTVSFMDWADVSTAFNKFVYGKQHIVGTTASKEAAEYQLSVFRAQFKSRSFYKENISPFKYDQYPEIQLYRYYITYYYYDASQRLQSSTLYKMLESAK